MGNAEQGARGFVGQALNLPAVGLDDLLDRRPEQAVSEREQREQAVRLLYVAMTRARDVLVVPSWPKRGRLWAKPP